MSICLSCLQIWRFLHVLIKWKSNILKGSVHSNEDFMVEGFTSSLAGDKADLSDSMRATEAFFSFLSTLFIHKEQGWAKVGVAFISRTFAWELPLWWRVGTESLRVTCWGPQGRCSFRLPVLLFLPGAFRDSRQCWGYWDPLPHLHSNWRGF